MERESAAGVRLGGKHVIWCGVGEVGSKELVGSSSSSSRRRRCGRILKAQVEVPRRRQRECEMRRKKEEEEEKKGEERKVGKKRKTEEVELETERASA